MFYVLLTGEGDGCDYTIGCNKDFRELKAKNWKEAKEEVVEIIGEYGEPAIKKARILEVVRVVDFED